MLPHTMADVDAPWLSEVLGTPVQSVRPADLDGEIAMTAQVTRLLLEGDGPASIVIKLGSDPACAEMYEREVRTYQTLGDVLPVPHCYYAACSEERTVLVLEDLSSRRPGPPLTGMTWPQAQALLKAARHWHTQPPEDWSIKVLPEGDAFSERVRDGWARLDHMRFAADADGNRAIEQLLDTIPADLDTLRQAPRALTHNDLHAGNLWFDGDRPYVLDWQNTAFGPVARDLAGILTCTHPEHQAALWHELTPHEAAGTLRGGVSYHLDAIAWLADHADTTARDEATMQGHWARLVGAVTLTASC